MRLKTVCMGVIALTATISAPQNDEKYLRQFGIFWSYLPQYQKGGVRPVSMITPHILWDVIKYILNIIDHREYYFT